MSRLRRLHPEGRPVRLSTGATGGAAFPVWGHARFMRRGWRVV
ncbi:hypothetical protein [Verminephrobacter eiseniae]|nr:hypothetical protein [Verminephrobacter eiseniae]